MKTKGHRGLLTANTCFPLHAFPLLDILATHENLLTHNSPAKGIVENAVLRNLSLLSLSEELSEWRVPATVGW